MQRLGLFDELKARTCTVDTGLTDHFKFMWAVMVVQKFAARLAHGRLTKPITSSDVGDVQRCNVLHGYRY